MKLEFHGSKVTSDGGLLAYRQLDDLLGLTGIAGEDFADPRTGKNGHHGLGGPFRQSVFIALTWIGLFIAGIGWLLLIFSVRTRIG